MQKQLEEYFNGISLPTPQYPEKQHDIERERKRLKESLKDIISILDLDNMNIAIKNIITKMMLRFVCSYRSVYSTEFEGSFDIQQIANGFIISYGNSKLSISIDGTNIIIKNNCDYLNFSTLGENYANCTLSINKDEPNIATQVFITESNNKLAYSQATFISKFNDEGLEQEKAFNMEFYEDGKKSIGLKGKCKRSDYFHISTHIEDYYSDEDLENSESDRLKNMEEKIIPASYLNPSGSDSNMMFNYSDFILLNSLNFSAKLMNAYLNERMTYDRLFGRVISESNSIVNSPTTDVNLNNGIMCSSRIDGGYSEEIMTNIKKYMDLNNDISMETHRSRI